MKGRFVGVFVLLENCTGILTCFFSCTCSSSLTVLDVLTPDVSSKITSSAT